MIGSAVWRFLDTDRQTSQSNEVFVTNSDCLENAHYLAGERVSYINHPYDESHGDAISGSEDLCGLYRIETGASLANDCSNDSASSPNCTCIRALKAGGNAS